MGRAGGIGVQDQVLGGEHGEFRGKECYVQQVLHEGPPAAKAKKLLAGKPLDNYCDSPGDDEAGPGAAGMQGVKEMDHVEAACVGGLIWIPGEGEGGVDDGCRAFGPTQKRRGGGGTGQGTRPDEVIFEHIA